MDKIYYLIAGGIAVAVLVIVIITKIVKGKKTTSATTQVELSSENTINETSNKNEAKDSVEQKEIAQANTDNKIDLEKLRKQIKKLEDELEDTQDELDDSEDELKKKKQELSELKEKYSTLKEEHETSQEALSNVKKELDDKAEELQDTKEDLSLKDSSLGFVKELLTAKLVDDDDIKKSFRKIENLVDFIRGDLKTYIDTQTDKKNNDTWKYLCGSGLDEWEAISKKRWLNNKKTVAFVGEFSAGKTSIVNKILKANEAENIELPVSTKATTAIPTYIAGNTVASKSASYRFFTPSNELKIIKKEIFEDINKEILAQVEGISSLIKYFVLECKNPNLQGMSILDTPGFSSNDKEDAERTIEVINECDALFWIFDVNNGTVNKSSLETIHKNFKKPLYIVINKTDTKAPSAIDDVEKKIKQTLKENNVEFQEIIRFSQKEPIEKIINAFNNIQHSNDTRLYIEKLSGFINEIENECREDVSEKRNNIIDKQNIVDIITSNIERKLKALKRTCDSANDVIKYNYKNHLFVKNKYELPESDGEGIRKDLSNISETEIPDILRTFERSTEATKELQEAHNEYETVIDKAKQFDMCKEKLTKYIESF